MFTPHEFSHRPSVFECMQDEEVVVMAKGGRSDATEFLLSRYRPLVENKARTYFLIGADHEDVVQEGLIGLIKAIRDFRTDRPSKFKQFAELCVTRQIITAVKTATRLKHLPLNDSISLASAVSSDARDTVLEDVVADTHGPDPESVLLEQGAWARRCERLCGCLSDFERNVLRGYVAGLSYREIADRLHCHTKAVDNALQRIKKKVTSLSTEGPS
ncbi:MAG: RNA polymerase sporulation sigma factor SigH [Fimbriimonadales bacterium]